MQGVARGCTCQNAVKTCTGSMARPPGLPPRSRAPIPGVTSAGTNSRRSEKTTCCSAGQFQSNEAAQPSATWPGLMNSVLAIRCWPRSISSSYGVRGIRNHTLEPRPATPDEECRDLCRIGSVREPICSTDGRVGRITGELCPNVPVVCSIAHRSLSGRSHRRPPIGSGGAVCCASRLRNRAFATTLLGPVWPAFSLAHGLREKIVHVGGRDRLPGVHRCRRIRSRRMFHDGSRSKSR